MPTFYIVNRNNDSPTKRIAIVYAADKAEAKEKLLSRFPKATDIIFIDRLSANPSYSACIIK